MTKKKTRHSIEFKAKVAIEAAKEVKPLNELSSQYGIHPSQISQWKRELLEGAKNIFLGKRKDVNEQKKIDELHRQISQLTMECDWLKKKLSKCP